MDKRIEKEHLRLENLLDQAKVSKQNKDALAAVIDNLAWQRIKLEDIRNQMLDADVVIPYNNGGGQEGLRENPIFKGYINLWRAYILGIEKLTSYLPKDLQEAAAPDASSVLEKVKSMKRKGKVKS